MGGGYSTRRKLLQTFSPSDVPHVLRSGGRKCLSVAFAGGNGAVVLSRSMADVVFYCAAVQGCFLDQVLFQTTKSLQVPSIAILCISSFLILLLHVY